jgi:hypothetical protein
MKSGPKMNIRKFLAGLLALALIAGLPSQAPALRGALTVAPVLPADPFAAVDGSLNATVTAAGPQFPNQLNSYGGVGARSFTIGAPFQPQWRIAGVDYPVGINDSAKPLKNVLTATLPGCATTSGNTVTVNSASCTLNGFDFSVSGGVNLVINGDNATVTNNFFQAGSNMTGTAITANNPGALISYNEFAGTGLAFPASRCITIQNQTGTVTVTYNYIHEWNDDSIRIGNQPTGVIANAQMIIKYNAIFSGGYSGVHFDFLQTVQASYNNLEMSFNFIFQPASDPGTGVPTEATAIRNSDFGVSGVGTYLGSGTQFHHNTVVGLGNGSSMAFSQSIVFGGTGGTGASLNSNPTAHDNFFDLDGNLGPVFDGGFFSNPGQIANPTFYNNYDMTKLSATFNNTGFITIQLTSSSLGFAQPASPATPTLNSAVASGSAVLVGGKAAATPSGGVSGNYVINVFATDLAWPASLISAGTTSVAPNGTFSLTTSNLPTGTHTIQFFTVDQNGNASPLSNAINVTI